MQGGDSSRSRRTNSPFRKGRKAVGSFSKMSLPGSILAQIHEVRQHLIEGLQSKSHESGWDDPTPESEQALWTCLEVCRSLLQERVPIPHLHSVIGVIEGAKITVDGLTGWESECIPGSISTYMTSDAGLLFLVLGRFNELREVLETLKAMQHTKDGGWGVCHEDNKSRTKATAWALMLYSRCLKSSGAFDLVDMDSYASAIRWLNSARNQKGGWANNDPDELPSVSCTAIALYSLLTTEQALKMHPNPKIALQRDAIQAGLLWLIAQATDHGLWVGDKEDFGIPARGRKASARRHISGGLGTLFVAQVLSAAARLEYIRPGDPLLLKAVDNILSRAHSYHNTAGRWIIPSDSNDGSPNSWNSAFALDAFADFETLYLEYLRRGYIEASLITGLLQKARRWRILSIFVITLMGLIILIPRLDFLGYPGYWFGLQPALTQGIILIVLGAVLTPVVGRVVSWIGATYRRMLGMLD